MTKRIALVGLLALVALSACGPATFTRTRMVYEPFEPNELRQEKDRIVVELKNDSAMPPTFYASVAQCDRVGRIVVDPFGQPMVEQISLHRPSQVWSQVAITNHTGHVIRMNGVALRLFDPSGSQYEPLSRDDLTAQLYAERPCSSTRQADYVFRSNKIFDRNIEVVPGTTSSFWVPFRPASKQMTGVWKFSVYEVPVVVDSAGRPSKTTHFEMRIVAKQIQETLRRESPGAPAVVVSTTENSPVAASAGSGNVPSSSAAAASRRDETSSAKANSTTTGQMAQAAASPPNKETIGRAQARLKALGFDAGLADGIAGAKTKNAVRQFQASKGLTQTGELDSDTLRALGLY